MKKSIKSLGLLALLAGSLVACGSTSSSVVETKAAKLLATYDISSYSEISSMGWYIVDDYQLVTYDDATYRLIYTEDMFGAIDSGYETKGHRVLVTEGTYTTKASSDGLDGHVDYSLSASPIVFGYQHDKGYGRNSDILGTTTFIDTSNWTEAMTNATVAAYPNGASDILTKYGSAKTVTVEEPSANIEDTTLAYQMVSLPTNDSNGAAAPALNKFKTMKAGYDLSSYSEIAQMGWLGYENTFVLTFSDNTYFMDYHFEYFGAIEGGYEAKGTRNVITEGTYTLSNTSSDEIDGHGDIALSASDRVYLNQHHKGWSRGTDVIGTPLVVDTDNWTDVMTSAISGTYATKEEFMAKYGGKKKGVVSDPTFNTEDTTLAYKLISLANE